MKQITKSFIYPIGFLFEIHLPKLPVTKSNNAGVIPLFSVIIGMSEDLPTGNDSRYLLGVDVMEMLHFLCFTDLEIT